jgi:ribokinase
VLESRAMTRRRAAARALVLGDINVDVVARVRKLPRPGEDCLSARLELHCGGVAANTAVALARWGLDAELLGCIGDDRFGERVTGWLRRERVNVSRVRKTARHMTGLMYIIVTPDGQRTIFGSRGANTQAPRPLVRAGTAAVHLVGYSFLAPATAKAARHLLAEARRRKAGVSLDVGLTPAQQIRETILQVVSKVDILFVGFDEAKTLTRQTSIAACFDALAKLSSAEIVMKLGKHGCAFRSGRAARRVPGFRVAAVDTTGAGDAFDAAYLRARLVGWPQEEACLVANAAGAVAASALGAGESMPRPNAVLRLLRRSRLGSKWNTARRRIAARLRKELQ